MLRMLDWKVFANTCRLQHIETGEEVKLSPRLMDVLNYLIDCQGEVVSSATLLDKFWSRSVNSDHAVHNAIAELRSALGDHAGNPRYIKTYPKRGYALIATPVPDGPGEAERPDGDNASAPGHGLIFGKTGRIGLLAANTALLLGFAAYFMQAETGQSDSHVLLVRPLDNINVDADNRFWADQLPASLVTHLSNLPNTIVVSGFGDVSAEAYVQANFQEDIDYVLGGNVHQADNALRLQINLLNARDNSVVFSDQLDISSARVFEVHDEVGRSVVAALSIFLDESQQNEMQDWGTSNPLAYSHFLEAGFYTGNSNHQDLQLAFEHYNAATEEDPAFINAYIGLVRAASSLGTYSQQGALDNLGKVINEAIREVSRIAPEHPSLSEMRNNLLRLESGTSPLIEATLREQILNGETSSDVYSRYANMLAEARLYAEASQFLQFAEEDEPYTIPRRATWVYQTFFNPPPALIQDQKKILLERPDHIGILTALIRGLVFTGDYHQATRYLDRLMAIDAEGPFTMLSQALISGMFGSSTEAADRFARLNADNPEYNLSHGVKSFIEGDIDSGIAYWQQLTAADIRRLAILAHKMEMYFPDEVVADMRYQALLEELNMGLSWQRQLMESIAEMQPVTGIGLHAASSAAYERGEFLARNNLWDHDRIDYPDRDVLRSRHLPRASE